MKERIITGVILAILALWAILGFSPRVFAGVIGVVMLIASLEWATSFLKFSNRYLKLFYVLITAVLGVVVWNYSETRFWVLAISVVWWVIAFILVVLYSYGIVKKIHFIFKFFIGLLVILPAWAAVIILKNQNVLFLVFVILAVALADSGAYFIGRIYGKHKLAPVISPKKTWEGLIGGVFFSLLGSIIFALALRLNTLTEFAILITLGVLVVFFALLGDLFESMIKREIGIKDSGNILPGHGGILDRLDSMFVALPLFVFCANLVGFSFQ